MLVKELLDIDNLIIYQDTDLYRFTSDAIILSKFARAKKGEVVADFCSGSGIVGLHYYALNKDLVKRVDLYEMQTPLFDLSKKTVLDNGLTEVIFPNNIKVQDISVGNFYDTVLCNPPYVKMNSGLSKEMPMHLKVCREEVTLTFAEICRSASKVLKQGGRFCFVHRADRLAEIIWDLKSNKLEPKRLQMVNGNDNSSPYLVLVEAVKGGKSGLTVLPNLTNK